MRWCHGHARLEEGPPWPCFPNVPNPTNDALYRHDAEERAITGSREEFREHVLGRANNIAKLERIYDSKVEEAESLYGGPKSNATMVLRTPKKHGEQDFALLEREIRKRFPK